MKHLLPTITSAVFFSSAHGAEWNSTPEALVHSFQRDYIAWNASALALDKKHGMARSMAYIEREYARLLEKYCLPNFKGEPIAYGTDPSHDPAREKIISIQLSLPKATVRVREALTLTYAPISEYEMINSGGRWYLLQIYLIDGNERLPGL